MANLLALGGEIIGGGEPTIIARTNKYTKFADGLLICYETKSITNGTTAFSFEYPFTEVYTITASFGAGGTRQPVYIEDVSLTGFNAIRPDSTSSNEWFRYIAIGSWN